MTKKKAPKKKERKEKYEEKLVIKGTLTDVLKVSIPKDKKKND